MYKAILSYDGSQYFGWQKTKTGPSIQEELEKAIFRMTGESSLPEAASRTDRGVHARGQVIQFSLAKNIDPHQLLKGLNAHLPLDIRICELTYCDFHPTLDAIGKEYHYEITSEEDPTKRLYSWYIPQPLDLDAMKKEAQTLLGYHDFSAFANEKKENPFCTLHAIEFKNNLTLILKGDRFLYKMVRNLVGTLVYVGLHKINSVAPILASRDRKNGGITAPKHGLHLHQVFYSVKLIA